MAFDPGSDAAGVAVLGAPSVKRQKTTTGYNSTLRSCQNIIGFNSDNDSGDDLFEGFVPDTPATYQTQPTQILDRSGQYPPRSPKLTGTLQNIGNEVASSPPPRGRDSPTIESTPMPRRKRVEIPSPHLVEHSAMYRRKPLSAIMAPAGTEYRPPHGIQKSSLPAVASQPITIDDDGATYLGGSSDDEIEEISANIQPSAFNWGGAQARSSVPLGHVHAQINPRFLNVVQSAIYKPQPNNRSVTSPGPTDQISTIIGNGAANKQGMGKRNENSVIHRQPQMQARPERAQPIQDISIDELAGDDMKSTVTRLRQIYPSISVFTATKVLRKCKGSLDDAASVLAEQQDMTVPTLYKSPQTINLLDDSESSMTPKKPEIQMKRTLNAPAQSIRDKYSSTQPRSNYSSQPSQPQKKKLVRGRRNASSPVRLSSPPASGSMSDFDSGVRSATDKDDEDLEDRVLKYLNTCSIPDLVELINVTKEVAQVMLAARPFKSLRAARVVENTKPLKSGKKSTRAAIGDKIVDTAIDMFQGYEAIDTLVEKCGELSKPLTAEMAQWGFDIFGAHKSGELEMTSLDDADSQRDSAIGTPSPHAASQEGDDEVKANTYRKRKVVQFLQKPISMADDLVLKDYQIVGLNWLALMSRHGISGILADEMGLGKTCQVISFLTHLVENGNHGPHLVVCPGSTLENWLREIKRFAPSLTVEPYHGPQKERVEMADSILSNRDNINVIVTTYDMAAKSQDNKFMRRLRPDVCVYDEGHVLKNVRSQRYKGLVKIPARLRLLLTGTPLQNNLQELAALLAFILPDVFRHVEEDLNTIFKAKATTSDSDHAALLSAQRIARARSMLTPFVLRRKKSQVLKHLPAKHCRTEYCVLYPSQQDIYDGHLDQAHKRAGARLGGSKVIKSDENNPLMQLRKASIHPLLFRRHFDDEKIEMMADILRKKEPIHFPGTAKRQHLIGEMRAGSDFWLHQWCRDYPCIAKFDIPDLAWMDSGKVEAMMKLVQSYKEKGDRVLIFSQFSLVLDILEAVLNTCLVDFTRIDGSTKIDERQSLIDNFRDDTSITVFLLTTKAGGTGINLMYANKVIIFDGSFNPQEDKQAENRAHRVGQTREVEVVRLVTRGTIEEQILALGDSKLVLDGRVSGDEDAGKMELAGEKVVSNMLLAHTRTRYDEDEATGPSYGGQTEAQHENNQGEEIVDSRPQVKNRKEERKKNSILDMLRQNDRGDKVAKKSLGW